MGEKRDFQATNHDLLSIDKLSITCLLLSTNWLFMQNKRIRCAALSIKMQCNSIKPTETELKKQYLPFLRCGVGVPIQHRLYL